MRARSAIVGHSYERPTIALRARIQLPPPSPLYAGHAGYDNTYTVLHLIGSPIFKEAEMLYRRHFLKCLRLMTYENGLYLEGLIIGGKFAFKIGWAYNWGEICVSNLSCANDNIEVLLTRNS